MRTQTTQLKRQKNSKKPRNHSIRGKFRNRHAHEVQAWEEGIVTAEH